MRTILDKICGKNLNTRHMLNNVFPQIPPFINVEKYSTAK